MTPRQIIALTHPQSRAALGPLPRFARLHTENGLHWGSILTINK